MNFIQAWQISAIKEYAEFGAGFKVALRDLEIRGAGNLLGAEQHGYIESVGYDLYVRLLSEAVLEERGEVPKAAFEVNGEIREDLLVPGNTIPMMNSMGGVIPGVVVEVTADSVKMDLNHQMAGKTLHFTGEVLSVREATEKELTEGLHGEFVHTCGCGGCHGGDCGGGCEGGHCGEGHDGDCGCGCH